MFQNLGVLDRGLRLVVGGVLMGLLVAGTATGLWAALMAAVALGMIVTALFGVCPLYQVWGISTCRLPRRG